jgi:hypothetical protein
MYRKYSTNWMGPINYDWIQKNGDHWAAGRIDVYGGEESYPDEIALPIMHSEDWTNLTSWLDGFKTKELLNLEQLVAEYEKTNSKIRWFNYES